MWRIRRLMGIDRRLMDPSSRREVENLNLKETISATSPLPGINSVKNIYRNFFFIRFHSDSMNSNLGRERGAGRRRGLTVPGLK